MPYHPEQNMTIILLHNYLKNYYFDISLFPAVRPGFWACDSSKYYSVIDQSEERKYKRYVIMMKMIFLALNEDYDMQFYLPSKVGSATLPYPIKLQSSEFSITLWVKYAQKMDTGTYFTLFTSE